MKGALNGVRVIDLGHVLAAPTTGMILADLGAEVIHVEPPTGDDARKFGPFIEGQSAYFISINRNKKSLALNLRKTEGKDILRDLIVRSGFDMCECFVCHPMVKCRFEDAYEAWKGRITIWGGIPSNILTDAIREEDFRGYVDRLVATVVREKRFILGVGDVVMPEAIWSRLEYISEAMSS